MAQMIMVVEDDAHIGALVRTYLERDGFMALWVRSGEDALVELTRHPIRLVVLDIGLPGNRRVRGVPADRGARPDCDADRAGRG